MNEAPHLTIITGASRGLGLAMAQQRLAQGHALLTLSRRPADLAAGAAALAQWPVDLAEPQPVARRLRAWLQAWPADHGGAEPASVTLINNAGVVNTPGPLAQADLAEAGAALRVGLEAALLLSAAFLGATAGWRCPRKLMLVSSGLGRRAMAGSAVYCAAKAGMDHLARALALEEAQAGNGARVASVAPGIIDTDMQVLLRSADPARFPEQARFAAFHESGQLDSPAAAAAKLLSLLDRADYGDNPVTDVRG